MNATGRLPGYTKEGGVCRELPPQLVEHDGKRFLMVHAAGFTTGLAVPSGQAVEEGRVVLTIWSDPPHGAAPGIALTFTPGDEHLDMIVDSLTRLRDDGRASAATQTAAALAKAAGK